MKTLVVCYSWTGNTAKVGKAIAAGLGCDFEEIREATPRSGRLGRVRCGLDSLLLRKPRLKPMASKLLACDLLILGCPVWSRKMASPMRSFVDANRGAFRRTATFCTEAGVGGELALETVSRACGAPTIARLVIDKQELASGDWREAVDAFVATIRRAEQCWHADGATPALPPENPKVASAVWCGQL
jgi:multimeric flavodoxin WrbA